MNTYTPTEHIVHGALTKQYNIKKEFLSLIYLIVKLRTEQNQV